MHQLNKARVKARRTWDNRRFEEGFYSKKARERLVEQDALSNEEAGFMEGYENWEDMF